MGATRPEEVTTGTAGEGNTTERPRNWKKDLKTKKHKYSKNIDGIGGGMRRGRTKGKTKGHDIRKSM